MQLMRSRRRVRDPDAKRPVELAVHGPLASTLPNTTCGGERRELSEFRERWEPALWVTLWAEAVGLRRWRASYGNMSRLIPGWSSDARHGA
jgi:hypothetical protein